MPAFAARGGKGKRGEGERGGGGRDDVLEFAGQLPGHVLSTWGISAIPNSNTLHTALILVSMPSGFSSASFSPRICNLISQPSPKMHRKEKVFLTPLSSSNASVSSPHFLHDHAWLFLAPLASPGGQYRWWSSSSSDSGGGWA